MATTAHYVSLIIPAHNEADNIGAVLVAATKVEEINEIIVVADACTDETARVAKSFGIKVIVRNQSRGKGDAMTAGVRQAGGDIIIFADADLEGLTPDHLRQVLQPVLTGQAVMSVGLRDRVFGLGALIPKLFPMYAIGGERAMTKVFFLSLPQAENILDFGIETVMNYYARQNQLKVAMPVLKNLHQVIKEKKWGLWAGFQARLKLMGQVARARQTMKQRLNESNHS